MLKLGVQSTARFLKRSAAKQPATIITNQYRNFFPYLRIAFNAVDMDRLKAVGPDRLCAEWVLKNGGRVIFQNEMKALADYNALPPATGRTSASPKIHTFDGTDSSIMAIGFDHFKGCTAIERIILHRCMHLENEALEKLAIVKDTLTDLQVSECHNIEDSGLLALKHLKRLNKLSLHGFSYVKDLDGVVKELQSNLPNCTIHTQPSKK